MQVLWRLSGEVRQVKTNCLCTMHSGLNDSMVPHNRMIKKSHQTISETLFKLKNDYEFKNAQDISLLGDVNVNPLNHASHSDTGSYLDTL